MCVDDSVELDADLAAAACLQRCCRVRQTSVSSILWTSVEKRETSTRQQRHRRSSVCSGKPWRCPRKLLRFPEHPTIANPVVAMTHLPSSGSHPRKWCSGPDVGVSSPAPRRWPWRECDPLGEKFSHKKSRWCRV